jgi:hypothetical protein
MRAKAVPDGCISTSVLRRMHLGELRYESSPYRNVSIPAEK